MLRISRWVMSSLVMTSIMASTVLAQTLPSLLSQMQSTDPQVRMDAFYNLRSFGYSSSDQVIVAVINLLVTENTYQQVIETVPGTPRPPDYGTYYGDVVGT